MPSWLSFRKIAIGAGVALVVLALAFLVLWDQYLRERLNPRNFGQAVPGRIYRAGQINEHIVRDVLQDNRVDVVLFLSNDKPGQPDVEAERQATRELGIQRGNFPLQGDGTGDVQQYIEALDQLIRAEREGKRVLVHCHTGSQRTGGLIAFYRVLVQGWSGQQAYLDLLAYNHDPFDNPRLIPYLNTHMAQVAAALQQRGLIALVPDPLPVVGP